MKKILFINLFVLLMPLALFSQSPNEINVNAGNKEINIRFGNNKKKGYYNTTQIALLMGNQEVRNQNTYYYPYPLASDYAYPLSYYSDYLSPYYYNTQTELQVSPSITMTNGYMFNEHWAMGIGVGFEIFDRNLFPAFADIRYTLWGNRISPYFAIKTGYAFSDFKKKHYDNLSLNYEPFNVYGADFRCYGGFMLNPEMGVKIPLNRNTDLLFSVAYRHQKIKSMTRQDYDNNQFSEWVHRESINRLSFSIGITFK
jgi:hypothetical protein